MLLDYSEGCSSSVVRSSRIMAWCSLATSERRVCLSQVLDGKVDSGAQSTPAAQASAACSTAGQSSSGP